MGDVVLTTDQECILQRFIRVGEPKLLGGVTGLPQASHTNGYRDIDQRHTNIERLARADAHFRGQPCVHPHVEHLARGAVVEWVARDSLDVLCDRSYIDQVD